MIEPETEPNFEDALRKLEDIVRTLESGDAPLDQSIGLFEEGSRLRLLCQKRLDAARLRIEAIAQAENGQPTAVRPFVGE